MDKNASLEDVPSWGESSSGLFTVSSAYKLAVSEKEIGVEGAYLESYLENGSAHENPVFSLAGCP